MNLSQFQLHAGRAVWRLAFLALWALALRAESADTAFLYLSGHGKDDAVPWRFFCTSGAQSGYWTNIPVPSNWELHGFGTLNYYRDLTNAYGETGLYEHDFQAPSDWGDGRTFLVFDGSMTDTSARLNGVSVGPMHQGGYYQFQYEVTRLLHPGGTNILEVTVAKHSANASVNGAERNADYWMYGGIDRPVYLEHVPMQFIAGVAVDGRADGSFAMDVRLDGATKGDRLEARIETASGQPVGPPFGADVDADAAGSPGGQARLVTHIDSPRLWTAETPNLYQVSVSLMGREGVLHHIQRRFGFRTFEVRDGDGLYLNGQRIILKGCNRHSFWPDSGRCLSEAVQRLDVETLKAMNMNAVRMSHYPPDAAFLDVCDEMGLYVLDELAGWHKAYDTPTGSKLVREMVERDVNHPSVLFWDNGNEGGFNTNLDHLFDQYDPQNRRVLHPWAPFDGLNTAHYLPYEYLKSAVQGWPITFHKNHYIVDWKSPNKWIYMPTEFIHSLYDGGAGSGLASVWGLMEQSPYLGGGFIWAYLDEGVRHPSNGFIDVAGNEAPDGIVGPYRQREASFYAIKQIWSPIQLRLLEKAKSGGGVTRIGLENHYSFLNAAQCRFHWELRNYPGPFGDEAPSESVVASGDVAGPDVQPGRTGTLELPFPGLARLSADGGGVNTLAVRVDDPSGHELWTFVWPIGGDTGKGPDSDSTSGIAASEKIKAGQTGPSQLSGSGMVVKFQGQQVDSVVADGHVFSLGSGPRVVGRQARLGDVEWTLFKDGCLQCRYSYTAEGTNDYFGVVFDYPEAMVRSKSWLGDGPYRVWKNRREGVTFGLWHNDYNDTVTGWKDWVYPEFKGCFSQVQWMRLNTSEGSIAIVNQSRVPFLQVLTPSFPPPKLAGHTIPPLPTCGLGFLDAIPAMGSKFQAADVVSPAGATPVAHGVYVGVIRFYFNPAQSKNCQ